LEYTGDDCTATSHSQDPAKVSCSGDPAGAGLVHIRATNKGNLDDDRAKVWFDGQVGLNELFVLDAANAGKSSLGSNTWIHILDAAGNTVLQTIKFHTSCSQLLFIDDQFGAVALRECIGQNVTIPGVFCSGGAKPRILEVRYDGSDCSATSHSQAADKVSCEGDPMLEMTPRIRASDKENPNDGAAKVWFDGQVILGDTFLIDAGNGGESRLKARTFVHIFDEAGVNVLQTIEFHTSCSQPLNVNDRFGSLTLEAFTAE
jgi:hypothetical protein